MKVELEVQLAVVITPMTLEVGDRVMIVGGAIIGLAPDAPSTSDIDGSEDRAIRKKNGILFRTTPPKVQDVFNLLHDTFGEEGRATARRIGDRLGYAPPDRNNRSIISDILDRLVKENRISVDRSLSKARPQYYIASHQFNPPAIQQFG